MPVAFVCITTEPASMVEVLKSLKVEGVVEAEMIYGIYDVVVKVEADSVEKLKRIITRRIRRIRNVATTTTMIVEQSELRD